MISTQRDAVFAGARPVGFGARNRRILLFGTPDNENFNLQALSDAFRQIANVEVDPDRGEGEPAGFDSLLRRWQRAEAETHAVSLGLVATKGPGTAAFGQIMLSGASGDPVPGAVALIGFDRVLFETLLTLAEGSCDRAGNLASVGVASGGIARPALAEWPRIAIVLGRNDPARDECAEACRRMGVAGIRIDVMLVAPLVENRSGAVSCATVRLAEAIDRFFADHLVADFPRMFRHDDGEPGWARLSLTTEKENRA